MPEIVGRKRASGQEIFLTLKGRIERGSYPVGERLPAERLLAQEFLVDRSQIRDALLLLEQQQLIVREPGRRPYVLPLRVPERTVETPAPRALRTIAAILPQHPIYRASLAILHGISRTLRSEEAPFRLMTFDTHGETPEIVNENEQHALQAVEEDNIAGVIFWQMGNVETLPILRRLQERGTAVVFVDRYPPGVSCDFVGIDNLASATEAVQHLLKRGHRRIAHLTTAEQTIPVLQRRVAYEQALRTAGITMRPEWIYEAAEGARPDIAPAIDQFFNSPEPVTGIFAMNDALAHYFIIAAEARGLRAPEEFSIVGFDDLERYSPRPALLTTMHQPFDLIGSRATQLLLRRLSGGDAATLPSQHLLLPTPLVVRTTCKFLDKEE